MIKEVRKREQQGEDHPDRDPDQAVRDPNRQRQHRPTSLETAEEKGRALPGREEAAPEAGQGQDPTVLEAVEAVDKAAVIGTLMTKVRTMGTVCMWQIWTARLESVTWRSCLASMDH